MEVCIFKTTEVLVSQEKNVVLCNLFLLSDFNRSIEDGMGGCNCMF